MGVWVQVPLAVQYNKHNDILTHFFYEETFSSFFISNARVRVLTRVICYERSV